MSRIITQLHEEMAGLLRKFKQSEAENSFNGIDIPNTNEEDDDGWMTITSKGKKIKEARHVC